MNENDEVISSVELWLNKCKFTDSENHSLLILWVLIIYLLLKKLINLKSLPIKNWQLIELLHSTTMEQQKDNT